MNTDYKGKGQKSTILEYSLKGHTSLAHLKNSKRLQNNTIADASNDLKE